MIITPQNITKQYYGKMQGWSLVEDLSGSVRVWEFELEKNGQTATYRAYVHSDTSDYRNDHYRFAIAYERLILPEDVWIPFDMYLVGLDYPLSTEGVPRHDRYVDTVTEEKKYPVGTYDFGEVQNGDEVCAFDTNGDIKPNVVSQVQMVAMLKRSSQEGLNDKALALMLFNL